MNLLTDDIAKIEKRSMNGQSKHTIAHTISAKELMERKVEVLPTLISPIIPTCCIGAAAGSSDAGKSMLFRQLCFSIVTGEEYWCGFKINARYKRAVYVSTEDDETAISFLLNKQNTTRNKQPDEVEGLHFIFDIDRLIQKLEAVLKKNPVDIIIIDAFLDLFGGKDVNQGNHVRNFLMPYSQLASKHNTCVLFIHHSGKRTESLEASKNNLLGSQAFEAKMRFVLELRTDTVDPNKRHLCPVKGNYLPSEYKRESFELRFEDYWFYNTGERAPMQLVKHNQDAEVIKLLNEGKTYQEAADIMGIKSKGTISKIVDRVSKVSTQVSGNTLGNNGNKKQ